MKLLVRVFTVIMLLSVSSSVGFADIAMNIWDDGTDLFMSATGDYDLSNAVASNNTALGANAAVGVNRFYGWEVDSGAGATGYSATYSNTLTGGGTVFPANTASATNPFFFWQSSSTVNFDNSNPTTGSVSGFAVFENVTLATLGMIEGESVSVTWGNGGVNERGTITVGAVPEPSTAALGIVGLAAFLIRRRNVS